MAKKHDFDIFSLAAMFRAHVARTWDTVSSREKIILDSLLEQHGAPLLQYPLPDVALRDLNAAVGSQGGYLVQTGVGSYVDALRPASGAFALGARSEPLGSANQITVIGGGGVTTQWLEHESQSITESSVIVGAATSTPKLLSAYGEISHKALKQSNAEGVIRREIRNSAAAAIDAAVIAGTGTSGQPTGIVATSGVGAVSGTSLGLAGITEVQSDVANSNGVINRDTLGWCTTPDVAALLKAEARFANTSEPLWVGDVSDGTIDGKPALSTTSCPAATAIYGDWSAVVIHSFSGGLQIAIDPATKFAQGILGFRLLFPVDIVIEHRASFSVISSIT